jgi:predicted DNA-binding transcriptional regulator YafY
VRADRLVSLVLLLRHRGQMTAGALARELEVSTRTVLRDIESLSAAGVPVYAERGRNGGFALLPGFETELTGLNEDEALALLVTGQGRGEQSLGLGSALASAVRKVIDALPRGHRAAAADAAHRLLVAPDDDLVTPVRVDDDGASATLQSVRRAVLSGRRLRIHYQATGESARWRVVDPIGLVSVRDRGYLLAMRDGADRTYRLSRVLAAQGLAEPAQRPDRVDLDQLWRERCAKYLSQVDHVTATVRVTAVRQDDAASAALALRAEEPDADGWIRLQLTFQDTQHAEWAVWQLAEEVEVLQPAWLRASLHVRASAIAARNG